MNRRSLLTLLYTLSNYVAAATIFLVPLFFLPITTDFFDTAKQSLFVIATVLLLVLYGLRGIVEGKFTYRHGPFNLGLLVLLAVVLISTFSAVARFNSVIAAVPWVALILFSIVLINSIDPYKQQKTVFGAFLLSGTVVALLTLLQFLKLYILPYPAAQNPGFSLTGSVLESSIFLATLLPFGIFSVMSYLKEKRDEVWGGLSIGTTFVVFIGFVVSVYTLFADIKPLLLPQSIGLKTALQPLGLNFTSALFGTGPGTYLFDFTRFRDAALNTGNLWNIRFASSSSIFLEVLG